MRPSQKLVDFIAKKEGFRSHAYKPLPTDRWTIGYGTTYIGDHPVAESDVITEKAAREILSDTLDKFAIAICQKGVPTGTTQQQFDAVVSLVYNIGFSTFCNSLTGKMFFQGTDISHRFELYIKSDGKVIPGLVTRRKEERDIYVDGTYA